MCGCRKKKLSATNTRNGSAVEVIAGPYQGKTGVIKDSPRSGTYTVRLTTGGERVFYASFLRFL